MKIEIDAEQFAKDIKAGKSIGGKDGALGSLYKTTCNFHSHVSTRFTLMFPPIS